MFIQPAKLNKILNKNKIRFDPLRINVGPFFYLCQLISDSLYYHINLCSMREIAILTLMALGYVSSSL